MIYLVDNVIQPLKNQGLDWYRVNYLVYKTLV